jgi:hypothetical protein
MTDLILMQKSLAIANVNVDLPVLDLIFEVKDLIDKQGDKTSLRDITKLTTEVAGRYDENGNLIPKPKKS